MVLHRFFEPSENLAGGEEYRQSLPPIIVFVIIHSRGILLIFEVFRFRRKETTEIIVGLI